jgi:hypothetical protein
MHPSHTVTVLEVQFKVVVQAVQTNIGGWREFKALQSLLSAKEIAHTLTCTRMHHQNGSVECKHMHVVETWLTLLTQEELPLTLYILSIGCLLQSCIWSHPFSSYTIK